jgi:hypothetical protein
LISLVGAALNSAEIKNEFRRNPYPAFIEILRTADRPLTGAEIMDRVATGYGVPRSEVKTEWDRFRPVAKDHHPAFVKVGGKWAYSADPVAPADALRSLLAVSPASQAKIKKWLRDVIVKDLEPRLPATTAGAGTEPVADDEGLIRASRERQFRIDRLIAIAEIAGEVEEQAAGGADPDMIVEKVQTRVLAADLTQIGHAGRDEPFDPAHHEAVGARPEDGAAVNVIRPGYSWLEDGKVVVLRKALVTEA